MKATWMGVLFVLLFGWLSGQSDATAEKPGKKAIPESEETYALVRANQPVWKIVTFGSTEGRLLLDRAVQAVGGTVKRWSGVELPVSSVSSDETRLPDGPAIVLATWDQISRLMPNLKQPSLLQAPALDPQGFVCQLIGEKKEYFLVIGRTQRGVYNGAQYVADFLIDGPGSELYLNARTVVRSPQMQGRPVYLLTIWGNEDEYTEADFAKVFDSFARDGMDRVYFWASGHFPSRKYPQTYRVENSLNGVVYDGTLQTGIGSVEALRKVMLHAHDRGLMFYVGGGLGGWVGTRFLTNLDPATFKKGSIGDSGGDDSRWSLCPSNPKARKALVEYYSEMFEALPGADGLYIESADEAGECQCGECSKAIDKLGSRQFGQSQLSLVLEIMQAIWRKSPQARLAYTIGYSPHKSDPAYYEAIRKMNDPRFEWMEARASWEMPGPDGKPLPARYFSPRIMGWRYNDQRPLDQLVSDLQRMGREGWYGAISTFSPGFSSGSFYRQIPFPTDLLPYVLTHFLHRELTWEPAVSLEEAKRRTQARFFGREAPGYLARDLWSLREMIRNVSHSQNCSAKPGDLDGLDDITRRVAQLRNGASPKTLEGLDLMARAIQDLKAHCSQEASQRGR